MTNPMPGGTAPLGGHDVARIGFGAMQLAGVGGLPAPDRAVSLAVLRRAVELGVNHIDTAAFYGDGTCNGLIREALAPYGDDLVLVSKVGARHDARTGLTAAQKPAELRAGVEDNLRQLKVDRVEVVNLRRMDSGTGIRATGEQIVDFDDQLAEMVTLRDEGKIGGIGLSTVSPEQLRQGLPAGITCVQNAYSLVSREDEPLLDLCREHGIAWVPAFPLGSAFPGRPKVADQPLVQQTAAQLAVTPVQVGLAWLLAHNGHTLLIPGTSNTEHLEQNLAAGDVHLDTATLAALDAMTI
jgi:aryl-alcohol dehydrogenase-like predicted oxidoreductase